VLCCDPASCSVMTGNTGSRRRRRRRHRRQRRGGSCSGIRMGGSCSGDSGGGGGSGCGFARGSGWNGRNPTTSSRTGKQMSTYEQVLVVEVIAVLAHPPCTRTLYTRTPPHTHTMPHTPHTHTHTHTLFV
jgi:hypothetical protein